MKRNNSWSFIWKFLFLLLLIGAELSTSIAESASQKPVMRVSSPSLQLASATKSSSSLSSSLPPEKSQVFYIKDSRVVNARCHINASLVEKMVDQLLCAVTGKSTVVEAWRSLVKTGRKGDRIGIKVAAEPGLLGGTHFQVVEAIIKSLVAAGVERQKIVVWDRRQQNLVATGYTKRPGLSLRWIEHGSGYDPRVCFSSPLVGQLMYGDYDFKESHRTLEEQLGPKVQLSDQSHYALILSRGVDKVINVPSLCDSYYSGIHGALANMTLDNIDNWRRLTRPPYNGDPAIGELYRSAPIYSKVVMTIIDGLMLQYAGGPSANPSHLVSFATLFASRDPVALDAAAIYFIDQERLNAGLPKIGDLASHVQSAAAQGLGHASQEDIEMIRVGKKSSSLTGFSRGR